MNFPPRAHRWAMLPQRIRGMFNLNDPRWGRGSDDKNDDSNQRPEQERPPLPPTPEQRPRPSGQQGQPPDLDELYRDLSRKLSNLFGGKGGDGRTPPSLRSSGQPPDFSGAGKGVGVVAVVALLIWAGTGIFIVQEGQQAVITQFGKYSSTVGAGFNWRLPYPFQRHEIVQVTQVRTVEVGRDSIIKSTGLRDSAMLTEDENIVEIKFAVQYSLNDAREWLFSSKNPGDTVVQVAESAVREVVGKMKMDAALADERDQIAPRVRELMQKILDQYDIGVNILQISLEQSGVRPPEQVKAAFDDVLKAGQERVRAQNEAQAYANDVIPRATGAASRLKEEADGYKSRVVSQAQGDAERFSSVLAEYQKAPQVTRDRMYLDTMQQIYSNATKVVVDSRQGSNMLYLPLDKLMQGTGANATVAPASGTANTAVSTSNAPVAASAAVGQSNDARNRDISRSRERESR